ncbi:MAG: copper-binding protein [Rhodanobacter sp.]|nr:copper-binding protein [Rhodanobacter sp.]ODT92618.1 MAG: copper-binding protein [Rhodanobacter sp. SCN 67-45]OJW43206.1 MAG: copper-binding protein [Rhodanobacter sp. 67-28]
MKKHIFTIALTAALASTSAMVGAQQMDPNMAGMHDTKPADVEGVGVIKAIDVAKATVTLQHEAITAIGWPAMTMPFKVASSDLLKNVKVGDKVKFGLHPDGMNSTVTLIKLAQ